MFPKASLEIFDLIPNANLKHCFEFILEIGKLKSVIRQTYMPDQDRPENSAEHSWHLAMMAILLKDYANAKLDIEKTLKMLVVHDLGEIYAGDTFFYEQTKNQNDIERIALKDLYQNLSKQTCDELLSLWEEFEAGKTVEAKYCKALDRFNPFLYQLQNGGESWRRNKIPYAEALEKNVHIKEGSNVLWDAYKTLAKQANKQNYFYREE